MTPYYEDASVTLYAGDCLDVLATLPDCSVDAVVTDPPYGLSFMGREWDSFSAEGRGAKVRTKRAREVTPTGQGHSTSGGAYLAAGVDDTRSGGVPFQHWCEDWARECLRVLKPGGHLLAFGGTRTYHRLTCGIEDAGFEIRDEIAWLYGSGFPKSLDVSKAIDKAAGAERSEVVGSRGLARWKEGAPGGDAMKDDGGIRQEFDKVNTLLAPATDDARTWQGWGTALKPAHEPIVVARKPLTGTVAANVLAHGTGALNVDGCRVAGIADRPGTTPPSDGARNSMSGDLPRQTYEPSTLGRWPSNVLLDSEAADELDRQSGTLTSGANPTRRGSDNVRDAYGEFAGQVECEPARGADSGGASRFFPTFRYEAKAPTAERPRDGAVAHPTVKPLDLMRWLVRLVTPPGGTVLEPFAGSGTTAEACVIEGFRCIAVEREPDYLPLIVARLSKPIQPDIFGASA